MRTLKGHFPVSHGLLTHETDIPAENAHDATTTQVETFLLICGELKPSSHALPRPGTHVTARVPRNAQNPWSIKAGLILSYSCTRVISRPAAVMLI